VCDIILIRPDENLAKPVFWLNFFSSILTVQSKGEARNVITGAWVKKFNDYKFGLTSSVFRMNLTGSNVEIIFPWQRSLFFLLMFHEFLYVFDSN